MSASAGRTLQVEAEPEEVGLDAERLERLERHFTRYLDDGRLPGWLIAVMRRGRLAYLQTAGSRDVEAGLPVEQDTLWRIYSMTKPITSVAAMMLWEEGAFELKDPVSRFIPSFADVRVYSGGSALKPQSVPATEPVRIWHLLTHTSGLTYAFHNFHPVDRLYREAGFELGAPPGMDLAEACDTWAALPLLFEPGTEWNYSVSTDVLGRVIEVVSGQRLDEFLAERILGPLGMHDTSFALRDGDADRLAALYSPDPETGRATRNDVIGRAPVETPRFLSGGGGLLSTAADYLRFMGMLLGGGELDGVRLLGPRTLDYMARNHLPGGADLQRIGRPPFAESAFDGIGFGLGFSVMLDPLAGKVPTSAGELAWGGVASTAFYVDPAEDLGVLFLTQLLPSNTHPIRPQLRQLVWQAIAD